MFREVCAKLSVGQVETRVQWSGGRPRIAEFGDAGASRCQVALDALCRECILIGSDGVGEGKLDAHLGRAVEPLEFDDSGTGHLERVLVH